jgi:hypothetical protein
MQVAQSVDQPQQLWLDVERPVAVRTRRAGKIPLRANGEAPGPSRQMELNMNPPRTSVVPAKAPGPPRPAVDESAESPRPQPFGTWLMDQGKRPGSLGELARAAKTDRSFPKGGSVDDVRKRFAQAGADGDAFEALDDAEREYDRQVS